MKKSVLSLFIIASFMAVTNVLKPNAAHSGENWKLKKTCFNNGNTWKLKKNTGDGMYKGKLSFNGDFHSKDYVFDRMKELYDEKCSM